MEQGLTHDRAIGQALPENALAHLQHVRRFAKAEYLSCDVLERLQIAKVEQREDIHRSDASVPLIKNSPDSKEPSTAVSQPSSSSTTIFLLAAPTSAIRSTSLKDLLAAFLDQPPHQIHLNTLPIPSSPPSDSAAAKELSGKYWPVAYKSYNPHGPQPVELRRSEAEIGPRAGKWIALARHLGREAKKDGVGESVGVVMIDPKADEGCGAVVAGAGDGRWVSRCRPSGKGEGNFAVLSAAERQASPSGNPLAHAVMRAIGMVGQQRVALDSNRSRNMQTEVVDEDAKNQELDSEAGEEKETRKAPADIPPVEPSATVTASTPQIPPLNYPLLDSPLVPTESILASSSPLQAGGYLCVGLDIYLSHEPCVMCSMAIVHSRFSRVVFAGRARTAGVGGLWAEGFDAGVGCEEGGEGAGKKAKEYGYGLFWRPELNWRMLAWEWVDDHVGTGGNGSEEDGDDFGDRICA